MPIEQCDSGFAAQTVTCCQFVSNMDPGLQWRSVSWPDGSLYEGLTKDGRLESHGVLLHPNRDRYEGQFENGRMDGYGVFVWRNGTIYRGEWVHGMMHGCGVKLWKDADGGIKVAEGKFFADEFVGSIMPCSTEDTLDAAVEADVAASQARSFQTAEGRRRLLASTPMQPQTGAQRQQQPGPSSLTNSTARTQKHVQSAVNWWDRFLRRDSASSSTPAGVHHHADASKGDGIQVGIHGSDASAPALLHAEREKQEKLGPFLHRLMTAEASKMASTMHRSSRQ